MKSGSSKYSSAKSTTAVDDTLSVRYHHKSYKHKSYSSPLKLEVESLLDSYHVSLTESRMSDKSRTFRGHKNETDKLQNSIGGSGQFIVNLVDSDDNGFDESRSAASVTIDSVMAEDKLNLGFRGFVPTQFIV